MPYLTSLHTADGRARTTSGSQNQAALPKRHDDSPVFFLQLTKIKTMIKLLWPLLILNSRNLSLISRGTMCFGSKRSYYPTWWGSTIDERVAGRGRPISGANWKFGDKMCHVFHLLQSDTVCGIINSFSSTLNAVYSEQNFTTLLPLWITYIWCQNSKFFFSLAESWLLDSNFRCTSRMRSNHFRKSQHAL